MLTILVFILPLIAALLYFTIKSVENSRVFTYIVILAQLVGLGLLYNAFSKNLPLIDYNVPWLSNYKINFHLGLNGLSMLMISLSIIVTSFVILAVINLEYQNKSRILGLIMLTEAALIGLFASKDIFLFYFFFELALIPIYFIANIWGGKNASKITFKMLVYTVFGSLLMLVAFVLLYMRAQTADIDSLSLTVSLLPQTIKLVLFFGFLIAFAIKSPIFPFHSWLPDTYSESPTPATMMLSGLLSKMGIYGIIRILIPLAPTGLELYGNIVITLSIIGLIYGSIIAIQQNTMKRVLAFSSFSHMGLMAGAALTLSTAGIQGTIFQVIAHAINAVGLFYVAKILYDKTGSRNITELGGIVQKAPKLAVTFLILVLSSIALPLTSGFIGEFLMLKAIFDFNTGLAIFAGLSVVFGAVYMLRYYQKIMFGNVNSNTDSITDIGNQELIVLVPIIALTLVLGLFPNLVFDISQPFVDGLKLLK